MLISSRDRRLWRHTGFIYNDFIEKKGIETYPLIFIEGNREKDKLTQLTTLLFVEIK